MKTVEDLYAACGPEGSAQDFVVCAQELDAHGNFRLAASAYDHAYGFDSTDTEIAAARKRLLDQLSIEEHGILFRYIPAGTFLMGSDRGDPDEGPIHEVCLSDYWLAETPLSLAKYYELSGTDKHIGSGTTLKLRLGYSSDWEAEPPKALSSFDPQQESAAVRTPDYFMPWEASWYFTTKPMVAVSQQEIQVLSARLSTPQVLYRPPTEAEWEKAARGGIIGADYPWGDAPPTAETCDFDHFGRFHLGKDSPSAFSIQRMRAFPPNGYGLYAMSGGVWEWITDLYDAQYYRSSPRENPRGPDTGEHRVLRGGSWADCAEATRVSFRMASRPRECPNIGFRLCRVERTENTA